MEIKDGKITPTSAEETEILSSLIREHEKACDRDPDKAVVAKKDDQLSGRQTFQVFCSIERIVNEPENRLQALNTSEKSVIEETIRGLGQAAIDADQQAVNTFSMSSQPELVGMVILRASHALTDRYD